MPYKVFVAGEEALAADANSYLMSQTVPRFTNATQRTSQLTAPVLNQLSMLDSRPGLVQFWNGSAWQDAQPFVQAGIASGVADGNGNVVTTFPVAFAAAPIVVASWHTPHPTSPWRVNVSTITATTVAIRFYNESGVVIGIGTNVAATWIAVGVRI
jgi:hypothetical protein